MKQLLLSGKLTAAWHRSTSQVALIVALLYLLLISLAEVIAALYHPFWGIMSHVLILFGLILHATLNIHNPMGKMLLSLALTPLIRIASHTVPLVPLRPFVSYILIYFPIAVATFSVMRCLNMKAADVGLRLQGRLTFHLLIALAGIPFGMMEYLILRYPPMIPYLTWTNAWLPGITLLMTTGFVEEFVFRGTMQRACAEALGRWNLFYISFLFAIVHVIHKSMLDIVLVFFIALFFAWVVKRSGSIIGVTLSHGVTNSVLFLIAPFVIGHWPG